MLPRPHARQEGSLVMNRAKLEQDIAGLESRLAQAKAARPAHDTGGEYFRWKAVKMSKSKPTGVPEDCAVVACGTLRREMLHLAETGFVESPCRVLPEYSGRNHEATHGTSVRPLLAGRRNTNGWPDA